MQQSPLPLLYEAGVSYRDEPRDVWRHAIDVSTEGWGDCEDLAAYRAAELRFSGEDDAARVAVYQSGPGRYHAVVARGDGSIEDPSKVLGMGQKPMKSSRAINVMGADLTPDNAITFEVIQVPGGWGRRAGYRGYIKFPIGMVPGADAPQAHFTIGPTASTPAAAAKAATTSAVNSLLKNPLVQAGLSQVPGGSAAAALVTNPAIQNAAKSLYSAIPKPW